MCIFILFYYFYQLLHCLGRTPGGAVVSDEQHLLKVLVSWRVGLGRLGHVVTLKHSSLEEVLGPTRPGTGAPPRDSAHR